MKKILLSVVLICLGSNLKAQFVNDVPLKDIDVEYMEIVGFTKLMSTKLNIELDFGQRVSFWHAGKETVLQDADGKAIVFQSMVDALNFMVKNGYEFVTAYAVTSGNQNVYNYLLRKTKSNLPAIK